MSLLRKHNGDQGNTKIYYQREHIDVSKCSSIIELLGKLDSLSTKMGSIHEQLNDVQIHAVFSEEEKLEIENTLDTIRPEIILIQQYLNDLSCSLQGCEIKKSAKEIAFPNYDMPMFEKLLIFLDQKAPQIRQFLLPGSGSGRIAGYIHEVRCYSRECELSYVKHYKKNIRGNIYGNDLLNRLSTFLYSLARYVSWIEGKKEILCRS